MKTIREIPKLSWLLPTVTFAFATFAPQITSAHGELEIQIAAVTKKIQGATTNAAQLYLHRAELHREHKDWNAAKSDYDQAARLDPKLPNLELCRAKMLDDAGELQAARGAFDKILKRAPKNGEALIGRARVLVKLNKRKSAIADFQRGLDLVSAPQPEYFLEMAQTLVAEGKTNAALQTLDRGIRVFGAIIPLQTYALNLELDQKNFKTALERIDTLIAGASRKENLLAQRGDIFLASGQTNDAQSSFQEALGAIKILPVVLQKAPPMQKLKTRINASLAGITNASPAMEKDSVLNAKNEN